MNKVKSVCFEGETICVGIDVHKRNWKVQPRMGEIELKGFSQDPDAQTFSNYFKEHYPGAQVRAAYEAGFCGFGIQRDLKRLGIECIVVNAADVPTSDKERKRKDDKRDARKLSRELSDGSLKGIYIPSTEMEHARSLLRERYQLVKDRTRCKNRIKHMLMFSGIKIDSNNWSNKYVKTLEQLEGCTTPLREALNLVLMQYKQLELVLKEAKKKIQLLCKESPFAEVQKYIRSIPGIGLINGMVVQTEIHDMRRFKTLDELNDYVGLVPDMRSSADKTVTLGISQRGNRFLKKAIVESSWVLIGRDPAMLMKYKEYLRRMNANKAIIRIGKHLLSRIRYVWNNCEAYQKGVVG